EALAGLEVAESILTERCVGVSFELKTAEHYRLRTLVLLGRLAEVRGQLPALLRAAVARGDRYSETNLRTRHLYLIHLADDDSEAALREVREAASRWQFAGFQAAHFF